jgi:hypothetical protein
MPEEYARGDILTGIFSGRALMPWEMGRTGGLDSRRGENKTGRVFYEVDAAVVF